MRVVKGAIICVASHAAAPVVLVDEAAEVRQGLAVPAVDGQGFNVFAAIVESLTKEHHNGYLCRALETDVVVGSPAELHRRSFTAPSTGYAGSTATNPGTRNCAPKPSITVASHIANR